MHTGSVPELDHGRAEASRPGIDRIMRANKSRDTKPELRLRRALHRRGLRYRVHHRPEPELRRTADLVFPRAKVAIFVDGCFWHGCPAHHRPASVNSAFWANKIQGTQARDRSTTQFLQERGWAVIRVWEHEDPEVVAESVAAAVRTRSASRPKAATDK